MALFRPNVAALLMDERGRLLVCERFKIPGAWQFPQGGVDEGEDFLEAVRREVEEEVGLPPESYEVSENRGGYQYLYPSRIKKKKREAIFDGQEQTYYKCLLKGDAPPINLDREPREFSQYRWIWPEEFERAWLPTFKQKVYEEVMRDFFGTELI